MAKNIKKEVQLKARQTKLMKRSHDELVEIVLRKDKTEHKLNVQIVNLKAEVNSLISRVNNFDKDQEGNIRAIDDWKKKYNEKCDMVNTLNESIVTKTSELNIIKGKYNAEAKTNIELRVDYDSLKKITWTIAGFAAICFIGCIFC